MTAGRAIAAAIAARADAALATGGRRQPVIVKVISAIKTRSGAGALVRYVARLGPEHQDAPRPSMHDEFGDEVPREALRKTLADWKLMTDRENLSPRGREVHEGRRAERLGPKERFRNIEVWHICASAPTRTRDEEVRFEEAMRGLVRETFARWGHPALWAVHREDGGHIHGHIIVRARSRDIGRGERRLRFDKTGRLIDALRHELAEQARSVGLDVEATRLADRWERRGDETAVRGQSWLRSRSGDRLRRLAPNWHARYVAASDTPPPPRSGSLPLELVSAIEQRLGELEAFRDLAATRQAVSRFAELVGEAASLAPWWLTRQPARFAPPGPGVRRLKGDPRLHDLLKSILKAQRVAPKTSATTSVAPPPQARAPRPIDDRQRTRMSRHLIELANGLEQHFSERPRLRQAASLRQLASTLLAQSATQRSAKGSSGGHSHDDAGGSTLRRRPNDLER